LANRRGVPAYGIRNRGIFVPQIVAVYLELDSDDTTSSDALAETVTVPATVGPVGGLRDRKVGGVVSMKFVTITVIVVAVAVFPAASRATAVYC